MIPYQKYFVVLGLYPLFSLAAWSRICVSCLDNFRLAFNGTVRIDHDARPLCYIACNETDHVLGNNYLTQSTLHSQWNNDYKQFREGYSISMSWYAPCYIILTSVRNHIVSIWPVFGLILFWMTKGYRLSWLLSIMVFPSSCMQYTTFKLDISFSSKITYTPEYNITFSFPLRYLQKTSPKI